MRQNWNAGVRGLCKPQFHTKLQILITYSDITLTL